MIDELGYCVLVILHTQDRPILSHEFVMTLHVVPTSNRKLSSECSGVYGCLSGDN